MPEDEKTVDRKKYPILDQILWSFPGIRFLTPREAFWYYEEQYKCFNLCDMDAEERAFFNGLVVEYGMGVTFCE